jgi:calmodulin
MALSESDIVSGRLIFQKFDKNDDGNIDHDELQAVMTSLGADMSSADINTMIREIDTDKNGMIDFPEFLTMISTKSSMKWMSAISALSGPSSTDPITHHNRNHCCMLL